MSNRYMPTGTGGSAAIGRIAFALGLEGPAIAVDTACSASLVAIHQAVAHLQRREADLALAGGVNAILSPFLTAAFADAGMLAPDGKCKTFDARADGYVRGEGCGMVVLKRLSDAQAAGDRIWAVIAGSAVNQDGASAGLTVPNGPAQEQVIRQALANAGVEPAEVDYLEAHGTGTVLGDPIEVTAAAAYGVGRSADKPLLIGSVKTNVGHLEAAAGVAGLIKAVLALNEGTIWPSLNFETPNPRLDWAALPVRVADASVDWPDAQGRVRRAAVSSFGFSGTNAHVILEGVSVGGAPMGEALSVEVQARIGGPIASATPRFLPLSGKSDAAVRDLARRYLDWLGPGDAHRESSADAERLVDAERLADMAWTAAVGRAHMSHRVGIAFSDAEDLKQSLGEVADGERAVVENAASEAAFLFTGQGSQWVGMGRALYETDGAARAVLDRCDEVVREMRGRSLLDAMFGEGDESAGSAGADDDLDDTTWTQPALYALGCALAEAWRGVGVRPSAVFGHSVGGWRVFAGRRDAAGGVAGRSHGVVAAFGRSGGGNGGGVCAGRTGPGADRAVPGCEPGGGQRVASGDQRSCGGLGAADRAHLRAGYPRQAATHEPCVPQRADGPDSGRPGARGGLPDRQRAERSADRQRDGAGAWAGRVDGRSVLAASGSGAGGVCERGWGAGGSGDRFDRRDWSEGGPWPDGAVVLAFGRGGPACGRESDRRWSGQLGGSGGARVGSGFAARLQGVVRGRIAAAHLDSFVSVPARAALGGRAAQG